MLAWCAFLICEHSRKTNIKKSFKKSAEQKRRNANGMQYKLFPSAFLDIFGKYENVHRFVFRLCWKENSLSSKISSSKEILSDFRLQNWENSTERKEKARRILNLFNSVFDCTSKRREKFVFDFFLLIFKR